ncbi:MAG: hypothetical protein IT495_21885 [Gammaproteobacteria bacterium]|nr:hypothetical protein [Gammaproteobacteria bacterium]
MSTGDLGRYYWMVAVPESVADGGRLTVNADRVEVGASGELRFLAAGKAPGNEIAAVFAPGCWLAYASASCFDDMALLADNWCRGGEQVGRLARLSS